MREEFDAAESLYRRLYDTAASRNDGPVAARAGLGIMLQHLGDALQRPREQDRILARSRALGEEILERFPNAPASAYVAFQIAYSIPLGDDEGRAASKAAYERVLADYPRSRHVKESRFREIFSQMNTRTLEQYLPAIEQFRRDFPDSNLNINLESYAEYIRDFRERRTRLAEERQAEREQRSQP